MERAIERLERAIQQEESICVWGDFDVDGQTSTVVLLSTLQDLGADVRYHIPTRRTGGHGVHIPKLRDLIADGIRLVLTCDTGVSAHAAIDFANEHGVDVVVTDHHDLPPKLPAAYAVVDPKMLPEAHPLRELPGVGVAYKLAQALCERAGQPEMVEQHLDLVALGIVADVATQTGDVRYLLQRGLAALRRAERLGLRVLMEKAGATPGNLTEDDIGFSLGPRLNSLGRLADASSGVELLTTSDLTRARILASELEGLNAQRKLLTDQVVAAAEAQIEKDPSMLDYNALVLVHPTWPSGVLGIVAGRLAERYHRPTILLTAPPGEPAHGSARSVEGCHITEAIAAHGEMLHRFGGHPMAAGLSIDLEKVPAFRSALSETVASTCEDAGDVAPLQIDGYVSLADLTLDLVDELERLGPFGHGNPSLTLSTRDLSLFSHRTIGRSGDHLRLVVEDRSGRQQEVVWWRGAGADLPQARFDLAYAVRASDYWGSREVQVVWVDARVLEEAAPPAPAKPPLEIVDYRGEPRPLELLAHLRAREDVQVWAEAEAKAQVEGQDRQALEPADAIAVWTTPPGADVLRAAMERVDPRRIFLFGVDPGMDTPDSLITRLVGLIKYVRRTKDGQVDLADFAAATAHRETTVRAAIAWLEAHGDVRVMEEEEGSVRLAAGRHEVAADLSRVTEELTALLDETAAYRAHFARADRISGM
jgi:single-stranded-DNA-specific exonuclease